MGRAIRIPAMMHTGGYHREASTMDPIDRNDPYAPVNPADLHPIARNDPYNMAAGSPPARAHDAFHYLRVAGVLLGVVVVLSGVYFAGASFIILRGIVESPQRLNTYLDEWYIPPQEPEPTPATSMAEPVTPPQPNTNSAQIPATQASSAEGAVAPMAEVAAPPVTEPGAASKADNSPLPQKPIVHKNRRDVPDTAEKSPMSEAIELLSDALTRGGLPRLAGALILLLLVSMLIRVPFGLVKAGVEIIRATLPERTKPTP